MRAFIIALCLAFSQAERVSYHYGQGGSHTAFENRFRTRGSAVSTTLPPTTRRHGPELNSGHTRYSTDTIQSGNLADQVETSFNKEFYSFSAPEDELRESEAAAAQRLALTARKNLRVVFIKAPENNGLTNAALQLAKQNAESKTAIYVLTKQPDVADLVNKLQNIQASPESKPEVRFVKYRTPEDAANAQRIIQNEYDLLGGTSQGFGENVAPVLDFTSRKKDLTPNNNNANIGRMNRIAVMLNSFLPSKTTQ